MKITFSILWFDDDQDYLNSVDVDYIKNEISSWGFIPRIIMVSDPNDFMRHSPFYHFDLIAVDYNLEAFEEHGDHFIKKLREHGVYTEVVFYSANQRSDLWDAVRAQELEGIFIASRTQQGEVTKILSVAKQSIKKFLDLNNIRGVIMAEVGNIDGLLEGVAKIFFNKLSEKDKNLLLEKYVNKIVEHNSKVCAKVTQYSQLLDFDSLLQCLDSNKKWNICQSISKLDKTFNVTAIGDYVSEILSPRNYMAHGIPEMRPDGSLLFNHGGHEYIFCDEESIRVRQRLLHYSLQLQGIIDDAKQ